MKRSILIGGLALLVAGPLTAQGFGTSIAVGDGEVLIGESLNDRVPGYVYVYRKAGDGTWTEAQRIEAADAAYNDHFGRALALEGNTLLVGATVAPGGVSGEATGAMYAFRKERDGSWRQTQVLVPEDITGGESFGRAAARAGELAMMAAWGAEDGKGAVYVYRLGGDGVWTQEAKLQPGDLTGAGQQEFGSFNGDFFGTGLDIQGEIAVVGAGSQNQYRGAAYIFRRTDNGWVQEGKLAPPAETTSPFYSFGSSILLDGDLLMVGAPGANGNTGVVHLFRRGAEGWQNAGVVGPFDGGGGPFARFGSSLAQAEGETWIGAPNARGGGAIYRLARSGDGWETATRITAAEHAGFGGVIDVRGGVAAVGLGSADSGLGRAAILERTGDEWRPVADLFTEGASLKAITGGQVDCADGSANIFGCQDVDMLAFLPVQDVGGARGVELNDVWGWTDPQTGREIAVVGRTDGTSFVDVTDPANPRYLGDLPMTEGSRANTWRDMKVYRNHAFVVADGALQHGMQVFDLTRLRGVRDPQTFTEDALYTNIASAHNIVIDTLSGFAFAVGSSGGGETCGGGLHMIDIRQPKNPTFAGCFADPQTGRASTGYSHDAQCVTYEGPDSEHRGKQICFGSNETALSIADVTDKGNPVALARSGYPNVAYAHQGWLTEDQRYFYMNDEGDETQGLVSGTRTIIWDVSDLDDPVLAGEYISENPAIDHNLFVKGNLMYQSNYVSGLRIFDVSQPEAPRPVGFFDTVPWGDDSPRFDGSWSNYPFFASGTLLVTSGREGLFLLKKRERTTIP